LDAQWTFLPPFLGWLIKPRRGYTSIGNQLEEIHMDKLSAKAFEQQYLKTIKRIYIGVAVIGVALWLCSLAALSPWVSAKATPVGVAEVARQKACLETADVGRDALPKVAPQAAIPAGKSPGPSVERLVFAAGSALFGAILLGLAFALRYQYEVRRLMTSAWQSLPTWLCLLMFAVLALGVSTGLECGKAAADEGLATFCLGHAIKVIDLLIVGVALMVFFEGARRESGRPRSWEDLEGTVQSVDVANNVARILTAKRGPVDVTLTRLARQARGRLKAGMPIKAVLLICPGDQPVLERYRALS
jgi:hypothetical protein